MNSLYTALKARYLSLSESQRTILVSAALFLGLTLQMIFTSFFGDQRPPHAPSDSSIAHSLPVGDTFTQSFGLRLFVSFLIISIACSALMIRKQTPWGALIATSACAALYTIMPLVPVSIIIAPLIAIYNVTALSEKNMRWVIIFIASALILSLLALTYATKRWAIELVGFTMILAAGALYGAVRRSDIAYLHEVQQRALEAERTKEQEAQSRVEAERVAIAREVHDIVAHSISIIAVQSAAADALIDSKPQQAHEAVTNIRETSKQALAELRGMINVLRNDSTNLTPLEPIASLAEIDDVIERVGAAGITVSVENNATSLPTPVSVSAYRIVQEALTNIIRHSSAHHVDVSIDQRDDALVIFIKDDGAFDPSSIRREGHGLQGMRERTEALGGHFESSADADASSGPTQGFYIKATIPLAGHGA